MGSGWLGQLRLCLWKQLVLKRRNPVSTVIQVPIPRSLPTVRRQLTVPVLLLLSLLLLRAPMPPSDIETCTFRARCKICRSS